jgi:uncharacterized protein (TIGR02271 family)
MFNRESVREGMAVYSVDGEKLGRVIRLGATDFEVEKGVFFPKDYLCNYTDVAEVRGDDIVLSLGRDALRRPWQAEGATSTAAGTTASTTASTTAGAGALHASSGRTGGLRDVSAGRDRDLSDQDLSARAVSSRGERDLTVPVAEEQLDVVKHEREAGRVRIHKEVVSEQREVSVPVREERVVVERLKVDPGQPLPSHDFHREDIEVPVHAEDVEVRKIPVVKEEVRIHKESYERERRVAAEVRKERVEVDGEGEVDGLTPRRGGLDGDPNTRY